MAAIKTNTSELVLRKNRKRQQQKSRKKNILWATAGPAIHSTTV